MSLKETELEAWRSSRPALLAGREDRRQFFVGPLGSGGRLTDPAFAGPNADSLPGDAAPDLSLLVGSGWWDDYGLPVVVDAAKALGLLRQGPGRTEADLGRALSLGRVCFLGTDGMRGKVVPGQEPQPLAAYLNTNALTPALVSLAAQAFGKMVVASGRAGAGTSAVIANDGRDRAHGWVLNGAVHGGFSAAGFGVEDLGTLPTPYVPWKMLRTDQPCGAVLTASHNPANQNGIKFFLDGKKLLPEGPVGDFTLSAWMVAEHLSGPAIMTGTAEGGPREGVLSSSAEVTVQALPGDLGRVLAGERLILDSANGAFFPLAPLVLNRLGVNWTTVNVSADGSNINRDCGVAELEGHHDFGAADPGLLPIVKALFSEGRKLDHRVYGLALDGDGDRGFVLVYLPETGRVAVLDGDRAGAVLASHFQKQNSSSPGHFVVTVESDLMCPRHARNDLGLPVGIVSVGDKWIGHYAAGPVLVGLEASGHVMFPVEGRSSGGRDYRLLAGNGLLSTLQVVYALAADRWSAAKLREPFEPGYSKTFYTYFVDKTRFFPGSDAWNADLALLTGTPLPRGLRLVIEPKEDRGMLYAAVYEGDDQVGAVFARNSGTEDKTAAYVQCRPSLKSVLLPLGRSLAAAHRKALKNPARREYQLEAATVAELAGGNPLPVADLWGRVAVKTGQPVTEADFRAVLYGLKKEGRAALDHDEVRLVPETNETD